MFGNPVSSHFLGFSQSLTISCLVKATGWHPVQAGIGGHVPVFLGSQECLHSSPLFPLPYFLYQNKGEKGSLDFFPTIYFYAIFQAAAGTVWEADERSLLIGCF